MEFLVTMTTRVPPGTTAEAVAEVRQREAQPTPKSSQSAEASAVCGDPR